MSYTIQSAVEVIDVRKSYGDLKPVDQLSFSAHRGEIFGLLGPNGAGKITTLEMIEGLWKPDSGGIYIMVGALSGLGSVTESGW